MQSTTLRLLTGMISDLFHNAPSVCTFCSLPSRRLCRARYWLRQACSVYIACWISSVAAVGHLHVAPCRINGDTLRACEDKDSQKHLDDEYQQRSESNRKNGMLSEGSYRLVATNMYQYCKATACEDALSHATQKRSGDRPCTQRSS